MLVFILDYSAGTLMRYLYFRQDSGVLFRTTYSIEVTKEDMLILGSSRANHHYNPLIFKKETGISCYNAGRDGCPIFYHFAVLQGVLTRYEPKIVILDFTRGEFAKNQDSYERISALLPYYKKHPEIRPVIRLKSPYEKFKLLSETYPFNSYILTILNGNSKKNEQQDMLNGFIPLYSKMNFQNYMEPATHNYEVDHKKVNIYRSIIEECRRSHIDLIIVVSPYYILSGFSDQSVEIAKKIAQDNEIDFFDLSNEGYFHSEPSLFADFAHLNEEGAEIFSKMITGRIKERKTMHNIE